MNTTDISLLLAATGALATGLIIALIRLANQQKRIDLLGDLVLASLEAMSLMAHNHADLAKELRSTIEKVNSCLQLLDQCPTEKNDLAS